MIPNQTLGMLKLNKQEISKIAKTKLQRHNLEISESSIKFELRDGFLFVTGKGYTVNPNNPQFTTLLMTD
jgi:hypothetical protein